MLTRNDVIEMEAGENLDVLVSKYVTKVEAVKPYSTSLTEAWILIDLLKEKGILIHITRLFDCFRVSWNHNDDEVYTKTAEEGLSKISILSILDL